MPGDDHPIASVDNVSTYGEVAHDFFHEKG